MLTDFYCWELLPSCTTGTAKLILCHMDQAWNRCRLWSIIWNQYFTAPLLNLSAIFNVANCAIYLSITSFLQLPSLVLTHASYFFNTHLHSLGNLSFHGLTQHCSFLSQRIFSPQLYQFLITPSPSILLSLLMAALPQIHLSPSPFSSCSIASCIVHYRQTPGSYLTLPMVTQHLISLTLGLEY